mmetsp:Transcript_15522/g.25407  ORF Transcript_15522/g.25407 Transcript_15522/m.25407 type:complete len:231 (+) Transcript_15522:34-726(+)
MVRSVSFDHVFKVPWEHATTAFWCKYPNRDLEHVKDALVLERYVDDDGILHTRRLMCIEQKLPALLKQFSGGMNTYYALETSTVDQKNKVLELRTENLTFSSMLTAKEYCKYEAFENGEHTKYTWSVECRCKPVPLVSGRVEQALVDKARFNSSAGLGKMEELTEKVSAKWRENQTPRFMRWPTRYSSRRFSNITNPTLKSNNGPRRYYLFGPRKPISESSFNPFKSESP